MENLKAYMIPMLLLISLFLLSCSGSSVSNPNPNSPSNNVRLSGTLSESGAGSNLTVNGSELTLSNTVVVTLDDSVSVSSGLKNGMSALVSGVRSSLITIANIIEAENEVQGEVSALQNASAPPTFDVMGQVVYVDDLTVYSNFIVNSILGLLDGHVVEVHGQRDTFGNIRATRVELLASTVGGFAGHFEAKGIVSGLSGSQFNIGSLVVDASGSAFEPAGTDISNISNGSLVEVEGTVLAGLNFTAITVQLEDLEDIEFEPGEGDEFEIEGYISSFVDNLDETSSFSLGLTNVTTSASTIFVGGSFESLMDNILVEAEGFIESGTLPAREVKFERARVRVEAVATSSTTLTLETTDNITVLTQSITDTSGATTFPMASPNRYEVRGYLNISGTFVAERVEDAGGSRDILQAAVDSIVGDTLGMLGLSIDISTVSEFKDASDTLLPGGKSQFLSLLSQGMTVKVRDDDLNGTWDKAEFEN